MNIYKKSVVLLLTFSAIVSADILSSHPDYTSKGESIYRMKCVMCHNPNGHGMGPSFTHLYQSQVTLTDGSVVLADEVYLRESILLPAVKVVKGYSPIMPKYTLTNDEVDQLVAYIESLK